MWGCAQLCPLVSGISPIRLYLSRRQRPGRAGRVLTGCGSVGASGRICSPGSSAVEGAGKRRGPGALSGSAWVTLALPSRLAGEVASQRGEALAQPGRRVSCRLASFSSQTCCPPGHFCISWSLESLPCCHLLEIPALAADRDGGQHEALPGGRLLNTWDMRCTVGPLEYISTGMWGKEAAGLRCSHWAQGCAWCFWELRAKEAELLPLRGFH